MKVKLWEIKRSQSGKAILFSTFPKGDKNGRSVWLAVSQIQHISRDRHNTGEWIPCVAEVSDWLAEKEQL